MRTEPQIYCRIRKLEKELYLEQLQKQVKQIGINEKDSLYGNYQDILQSSGREWCISQSSVWGIPIPLFFYKDSQKSRLFMKKSVVEHISRLIQEKGANAWETLSVQELLPAQYQKLAPSLEKCNFYYDYAFVNGVCYKNYVGEYERVAKALKIEEARIGGMISGQETRAQAQHQPDKKQPQNVAFSDGLQMNDINQIVITGKDQNEEWLKFMSQIQGQTTFCSSSTCMHVVPLLTVPQASRYGRCAPGQ